MDVALAKAAVGAARRVDIDRGGRPGRRGRSADEALGMGFVGGVEGGSPD
jgi:hypothetical protein